MEAAEKIRMDVESIFRLVREIRIKQEIHEKKLDKVESKIDRLGGKK